MSAEEAAIPEPSAVTRARHTWSEAQQQALAHYLQGSHTPTQLGGAEKVLGQLQEDHPGLFQDIRVRQVADYISRHRQLYLRRLKSKAASRHAAATLSTQQNVESSHALEQLPELHAAMPGAPSHDPDPAPERLDIPARQPLSDEEDSESEAVRDEAAYQRLRKKRNHKFSRGKRALMKKGVKLAEDTGRRSEVLIVVVGPSSTPSISAMGRGITFNDASSVQRVANLVSELVTAKRERVDAEEEQIVQPQCDGIRRCRAGGPMPGRSTSSRFDIFLRREAAFIADKMQRDGLTSSQHLVWRFAGWLWERVPEGVLADPESSPSLAQILAEDSSIWHAGKDFSKDASPLAATEATPEKILH